MTEFRRLFNKVDGVEVVKQYIREHLFMYAVLMTILNGTNIKALELLRLGVSNKTVRRLRKKYKGFIENYVNDTKNESCEYKHDNDKRVVWMGWLQGLDNAPDIVKLCFESVQKNIMDREIKYITEKNYREYVTLPDYIEEKARKGMIPKAHYMDIIRLELLNKYGGTWIDSTVFLTGKIEEYMLNSDLFLFQNMKPGLDGHAMSISNWFITGRENEPILKLTLALLYEYWKDYNRLVDYYIFHDLFQLAIEVYPEHWKKVVPVSNSTPHILTLRMNEKYDEIKWNAVKKQTAVHKVTYKRDDYIENQDTYYNRFVNKMLY